MKTKTLSMGVRGAERRESSEESSSRSTGRLSDILFSIADGV